MGKLNMQGVYRVYSMTRVNTGKQHIQEYTGYAVSLGLTWLDRIYRGIQGIQYDYGKHG